MTLETALVGKVSAARCTIESGGMLGWGLGGERFFKAEHFVVVDVMLSQVGTIGTNHMTLRTAESES